MIEISGSALVVEDNMIIAMEAEELLLELGFADCHVCSTVRSAHEIMAAHSISFALLDIDLGGETSEPIAVALRERGTPFIFASGYDDFPELNNDLAGVPVVTKPYTSSDIVAALTSVGL